MTSVLWIGEQGDNALTYYRQVVPGEALRRAGWEVRYAPVLTNTTTGHLTGWRPGFSPAPVPDVVVARHLVSPGGDDVLDSVGVITEARARGQRVFYDLDDDVWDLPEENPARRFYSPDQLEILGRNIRACDGVLVSTGPLAASVRRRLSVPVSVCPNGILVDPFLLAERPVNRPIRLGWCGLMDFRAADLALVRDNLAAACAGRDDVVFVHVGAHDSRAPVRSVVGDDFPAPVCEVGWSEFSGMPRQLSHIDAAIVPMRRIPLNEARSPTTGLALAAAGVPVLASAMPAYVELAGRVPGVYVIDNDRWEPGVATLLEAVREDRLPDPADMRRAVHRHYGPDVVARAWSAALSSPALCAT